LIEQGQAQQRLAMAPPASVEVEESSSAKKPPAEEEDLTSSKTALEEKTSDGAVDGEGSEADVQVTAEGKTESSWAGLFDISLGLGFANRNCQLKGNNSTSAPNEYRGSLYPEITIQAGVYPFVPFYHNFLRNIGLALSYSHHLSLSSAPKDASENKVDTTSQEFMVDAMYNWKLWETAQSPEVLFWSGFGLRDFDFSENEILASFNYKFFRLGLNGKVPLYKKLLALNVGGDIRPIFSVGNDQGQATYHYGDFASSLGGSVRCGVSGRLNNGLLYFANFEYLMLSSSFSGLKEDYKGEDKLDRKDESTASDTFTRFGLGVGYAL
jgi:hypothetical protein